MILHPETPRRAFLDASDLCFKAYDYFCQGGIDLVGLIEIPAS